MGFRLRRAMTVDAAAMTACINKAYAPYQDGGFDLPPVSEGVADDIRDHIVWLAVEGDEIIGGVFLSVSGPEAQLRNVVVDPGQSGRGIGRALIDTACTFAHEAGHDVIHLATHKDMPGNVALYRHLGWEQVGQEGNKVFMSKRLDQPG